MNKRQSHPPKFALFLLRNLLPKRNSESITGDLLEQFGEGRSNAWFWRQVLVAMRTAVFHQLRLVLADIGVVIAAVAAIYACPWGLILPLELMNNPDRMVWFPTLLVVESLTALLILPLFAALLIARAAFQWAYLLRIYAVTFILLTGADLLIRQWTLHHPVLRSSEAAFLVQLQVFCLAVTLLISAVFARRHSLQHLSANQQ